MKKAKNIITYVVIGIIIMWLAYSIVAWTLSLLRNTTPVATNYYNWIIPEAEAEAVAYTENDLDTFNEYQNRLLIAIQNIEGELKINKKADITSLQNLKTLLQAAFDRLPDVGDAGTENDTAKRAVDIEINIAIGDPNSVSKVGSAISKVASFISSAKINAIT